MQKYLDENEDYSITHYQITDDNIIVWFRGRKAYSYSNEGKAGKIHVDNMKALAIEGKNLCKYINDNVWASYDK